MFSYSLGPLIVALIFKFILDDWDKRLCGAVVLGGMASMNIGCFLLLLVNEDNYVQDAGDKGDKKLKAKGSNPLIGESLFNPVIIGAIVHKISASLTLMGVRYYSIFWKNNMYMTPFWSQIINFFTIISGSALSIFMTPVLCATLGDPLTVILVDLSSSIF